MEQGRKSFWEPPGRGKKQKEVRKKVGGEGGEKTSDREDLPMPYTLIIPQYFHNVNTFTANL